MADEIEIDANNIEDIIDLSTMLSKVLGGDVATAFEQNNDKIKNIQENLKNTTLAGAEFNIDESSFKTINNHILESQNSLVALNENAISFSAQLSQSADYADLLKQVETESNAISERKTKLNDDILSSQTAKLKELQTELSINIRLRDTLNPLSDEYIAQQKEIEKITSFIDNQKDSVKDTHREIAKLSEMKNFSDSILKSVSQTNNLEDALKNVNTETNNLLEKTQKTLGLFELQKTALNKVESSANIVNEVFSNEIKPQDISYNVQINDDALNETQELLKQVSENELSSNITANAEITGTDKVEELIAKLQSSKQAMESISRVSSEFGEYLANATTESEALDAISKSRFKSISKSKELQSEAANLQNEIKSYESIVKLEEHKLGLTTKGSDEYNQQLSVLQKAKDTLYRQTSSYNSIQSAAEELTRYSNEFLVNQEKTIKSGGDIQKNIDIVKSKTSDLTEQSNVYLKSLTVAQGKVGKLGDNYKKLAETAGPVFDSISSKVVEFKEKILSIAGSIPIFGTKIQENLSKPLQDATDKITGGVAEGFQESLKVLNATGNATDAMTAGFGKMASGIKEAGKHLKVAFSGPLILIGAIVGLLALAVKRFFELDDASQEFRKGLGLAAKQTSKLEKEAAGVQRELAGFGVSIEDAFESLTAMTEVMGVTALVTKEQVKLITMLNKGMGISAHTGAEVYETFKLLSGGSSDTAKNLTLVTTQLAAAAGVPLGKVMEDVANASDTVMTMSRGTGKELAVAAVEARRLGTNIESISSAMENQLDFETSIQNEMRMASMLGKHISMDAMRRASFEGDQVKYMAEQKKVMSQLGDLTKMNAYQRKAVADAMGIEVGELMKMQTQEKQLEALRTGTSEQRKALAEYEKMRDQALQGQTKSLAEQGMEMLKQQQAENVRTRLANAFNELMTELGSVLLPVVESAMNVLVPIVSNLIRGFAKVVKVVELLMQPFIFIGNVISALTGDTEGLQKQFDGLGKTLFAIGGILLGGLVMFATKVTSIGGLFTSIFSIAGKAGSTVFGKLASGITSIFSAGTEASEGFFSGVADKLKGMAGGIKDKLGDKIGGLFGKSDVTGPLKKDGTPDMRFKANKKPGVPDLSTDSLPDVDADKSSKLASFVENFNKIDMRKVIQAAAALAILSGALFVTAKALKEFNKVDWSSLVKGTLALGMLVGGLYGLSKVLSATKASLIQGAAAMFILGSALIPAAFAFKMFADVDWTAMLLAGVALVALGAAAFFLGGIAPLIFAGSLAIAALGASLIPFGIAALMAGAGMLMLGKGLSMTMAALGEVGFSTAVQIGILATAIAGLGILSPVMVIVGAGLMVFSAALVVAGAAVTIFGAGLGLVVESLKQLPEASLGLLAFGTALAFLAPLTPLILLTAASLGVMSLALIPLALASIPAGAGLMLMANALATISDADATSTIMNLVGAFFALGASLPIIALGVVSLSLITLALLPFSLAMGAAGLAMMAFGTGLSLTTSALQALGDGSEQLVRFGVAVSILGTMMPLIVLGAVSMGVLAAALIPLGIATLIAGPGLIMVSYAFSILSKSLKRLEVGPLFSLMGAFTLMGASIGFILLGAVALAAMSAALIPFGIAAMVAGAGMALFAGAFSLFATSMSMIPDGVTGTLIGIGIGMLFLSGTILAAIGATATLAIMAAGLFAFGIAATIAAVATNALGLGLVLIAVGLQSIAKTGATAIQNLALLGLVSPLLFVAAAGIGALAVAMVAMGAATAAAGILSIFAKDDPFEVYVRLGQNAETLGQAADGLKKIGESMALLSDTDAEDILEDMGDGFEELFDEIEDFEPETITKFATIGTAFAPLGDAFSNITPGIKPLRELLQMVSEQATFDTAIFGFDMLSDAILRFGEALRLTNPELAGMSSALSVFSQINDKTTNQATGEGQPIDKLQKNTNAEVAQNTSVGVKPKPSVYDAKEHFDKKFMLNVGGEDKFNQYMDNKKAKELADKELSAFRTENESFKITEQDELGDDVTVGYKGEDKNQKYQELVSKSIEANKAMQDSKSGLKNEYIKNTKRLDSDLGRKMAGIRFDTALIEQENQIPQDYSKSVSGNMVKESLSGSIDLGQLQQNTEAIQKNTEATRQTTGESQSIDKLDKNKEDSSFLFGIPSAIGDFFDGIFGNKPTEELQSNTEVAKNTSVGVESKPSVYGAKEHFDKIFMSNVGGEDKFNQYMDNKKAHEAANKELSAFRTENESFKITEQDEFGEDETVGYKGEDKNQKYQELLAKWSETGNAVDNSKRGLKNEYIKNTARGNSEHSKDMAGRRFDFNLRPRENQIPQDYSKSVSGNMVKESLSGSIDLGQLHQNTEAIQKNTEATRQTTGDGQSIDKLQKDKLDENKDDSFLFGIPSAIGDFFGGIFGSKPNEEETQPIDKLQKNTNVEVAQNTSVGVKPTTKFTESRKSLDDIFYQKIGGEDKFKQYMENKKAYETASSELHNFQAENKSSKVVKQIEDEFDGTIDSVVGYGDEDKNKKYQELLSKEDATRRTMNASRSGLKDQYMENSLGSSYSSHQKNKAWTLFDMHMARQENQIPMDYSKSVNNGITTETSSGKLSLGKQLPFETSGSMNVNNQIQEKSELESTNTNIPTGVSSEEMASGGADIPSQSMPEVVQQVASVPPPAQMQQTSSDNKGVEAKLDELINLMKSGGIAVNMDGKKVSTQLAKASP